MPSSLPSILALNRAQVRRGHQITVITAASPRYPPHQDPQIPVHRVFGYGTHLFRTYALTFGASSLVEILRRARRGEVDIIHTHELETALITWARRRGLGIPLAAHCHDLRRFWLASGVYQEWSRGRGFLWRTHLYLTKGTDFFWERNHLVGADVVFAVCSQLKHELVRYLGIPPERIVVIYNGVDADLFRPLSSPPPKPLPPGPRVLTTAGDDARKGIHTVLQVARIFRRNGWPGSFLVTGASVEGLQSTADPNVHILGHVPYPEMPRLYSHCDAYFLPSMAVAFSQAVAEAMACERPVVATRVGGLPEEVTPETGFLVPVGQPEEMALALHEILENPDMGRQMGKAGRRRVVENFTPDRVAERVEEGYRRIQGLS